MYHLYSAYMTHVDTVNSKMELTLSADLMVHNGTQNLILLLFPDHQREPQKWSVVCIIFQKYDFGT